MRVSTTITIGLVAIIGAACGLGAVGVAGSRHGLVARYYSNPEWTGAPGVEGRDQRITTGTLDERVLAIPDTADGGFSARWQGFLRVDQPAVYRFTVVAEDVAWLYLDGRLRVNNGAYGLSRQTAAVPLEAGLHAIEVAFVSHGGDYNLELLWADGPGTVEPIATDRLFPTRNAWRAHDAL